MKKNGKIGIGKLIFIAGFVVFLFVVTKLIPEQSINRIPLEPFYRTTVETHQDRYSIPAYELPGFSEETLLEIQDSLTEGVRMSRNIGRDGVFIGTRGGGNYYDSLEEMNDEELTIVRMSLLGLYKVASAVDGPNAAQETGAKDMVRGTD